MGGGGGVLRAGQKNWEQTERSPVVASLTFVRWISLGEEFPLPRTRIQVVHGTVPQKCARNTLPAQSGLVYLPALEGLRCLPLPTSSTRAPEVTPN